MKIIIDGRLGQGMGCKAALIIDINPDDSVEICCEQFPRRIHGIGINDLMVGGDYVEAKVSKDTIWHSENINLISEILIDIILKLQGKK